MNLLWRSELYFGLDVLIIADFWESGKCNYRMSVSAIHSNRLVRPEYIIGCIQNHPVDIIRLTVYNICNIENLDEVL